MKTHDFKTHGIKNYIVIQDSLIKLEKSKMHKLTLNLKDLMKEQQVELKPSSIRERIKIRAEINEIESKRKVEQINENRSWFFERFTKVYKLQARLFKKKIEEQKEKIKDPNKIINERGEITTKTEKI